MDSIVSVFNAKKRMNDDNVCFIDCRFSMQDPQEGQSLFKEGHVPGAVHFDLEKDLSSTVKETGGRHPLPSIDTFVRKIEKCGIDNNTTLIVYDDQLTAMASRFLWLMKYLGHTKVFLMDGGYKAWKQKGYPISDSPLPKKVAGYQAKLHNEMIVSQEDVAKAVRDPNVAILDARVYQRYAGWEEPIDTKAGHIPSAHHYFWKDVFLHNGLWKSPNELKTHFSKVKDYREIIVYCGSGVTATPNVVALWRAGFKNVRLYVGSWSDWITNPNNEIAKVSK